MRKKFLKWLIKLLLPHYHLARNPVGSGRKKKIYEQKYIEIEREKEENGG